MITKKPICDTYYDLPQVRSRRAAGFGYGHKYDFTKTQGQAPAPNAYNVRKDESEERRKKMGYSFGLSREQMKVTGGMFVGDKNSPGPGQYDISQINKPKIAFTFRPRITIDHNTSAKVPGPGQYPVPEGISKNGKYSVSKFKNYGTTIIAPRSSSSQSCLTMGIDKNAPGPGHYDLKKTEMGSNGSYFVSKFKSSLCRSFGNSMRKSLSTGGFDKTPGPGTYRLPSEFGHYEAKVKYGEPGAHNASVEREKSPEKADDANKAVTDRH
jgi:hypothetical protein